MFEARRLIGPEREEGGVTAKLMKSSCTRLVWFGLFFYFFSFLVVCVCVCVCINEQKYIPLV